MQPWHLTVMLIETLTKQMRELLLLEKFRRGQLRASAALYFVIFNSLLFILTTYFINSICFYLSFVALGVILGYSYTKRFTALCHLILGLGLSLAPIGAYLAVTAKFCLAPTIHILCSFLLGSRL